LTTLRKEKSDSGNKKGRQRFHRSSLEILGNDTGRVKKPARGNETNQEHVLGLIARSMDALKQVFVTTCSERERRQVDRRGKGTKKTRITVTWGDWGAQTAKRQTNRMMKKREQRLLKGTKKSSPKNWREGCCEKQA